MNKIVENKIEKLIEEAEHYGDKNLDKNIAARDAKVQQNRDWLAHAITGNRASRDYGRAEANQHSARLNANPTNKRYREGIENMNYYANTKDNNARLLSADPRRNTDEGILSRVEHNKNYSGGGPEDFAFKEANRISDADKLSLIPPEKRPNAFTYKGAAKKVDATLGKNPRVIPSATK